MRITWFTGRSLSDLCSTTQNQLATGLVQLGHEVTIINGDTKGNSDGNLWEHIPLNTSGIRGLQSINLGRAMKKWVTKNQSDSIGFAIVDWKIAGSIIPSLERKNTPWILMDRSPPADSNIFARLQWPSWKKAWRFVRDSDVGRGCVVSKQHGLFVQQQTGCQPEKMGVLNAGVDLNLFKPGRKPETLTLAYHGRVDRNRGVLALPMLVQKARSRGVDCKLIVIGEGDAFEGLKRIAEADESFEVVPTLSQEKLAERLGEVHIGLLPMPETKVWRIASPLKRSEYMASGLLVFGVDHDGHRINSERAQWMKLVPQPDFHTEGCNWLEDLNQDKIAHLSTLSRDYAEEHLSWEKSILTLQECMLLHPRSPS